VSRLIWGETWDRGKKVRSALSSHDLSNGQRGPGPASPVGRVMQSDLAHDLVEFAEDLPFVAA